MSPPADLLVLARTIAENHALDPSLVCAVIEQESTWDTHAIRYEPAFRTRYVAPLGLSPTEEVARSMSWGLMQVIGQVAREHGFSSKFLSALCDPAAGLNIGCAVLVSKFAIATAQALKASQAVEPNIAATQSQASATDGVDLIARALQLWNGGGNPNYASEVLARLVKYK